MSQTSVIESPIHALAPEATELTFGIHAEGPTTLGLAKSLGLIHDEFAADPDLNFSIDRFRSGSEEWPSEEDFRLVEVDHASALWERSRGLDSHLVGLSWMEGTYPVVALTGSGIRSVTELKGKRLGVIKASGSPFDAGYAQQLKIYTTVLSTAKLMLADVELVPIERPPFHPGRGTGQATAELNIDLAARLHRGEFDAITVALASDLAHQVSIRIVSDTQDHYDFIARVHPGVLRAVVVSGALLRQRRSLVVRALARLLEAADWAKRRTAEQVAARFAEAGEGSAEALVAKYDGLAQGFHIDFSAEKILGLRAQKNFLLRHQLIEKNFDLDRWIDQGPFAEAYQLYAERGQTSGRTAGKA